MNYMSGELKNKSMQGEKLLINRDFRVMAVPLMNSLGKSITYTY